MLALNQTLQFLLLNTRLPAAGSATITFFAAAAVAFPLAPFPVLALVLIVPVAFAVVVPLSVVFPFFPCFLVTTVVALDMADELEAAEWLLT